MEVSIIDYGMGNIRSVSNAVKLLEAEPQVVDSPKDLSGEKIIIPGVGAFGDAMEELDPFLPQINEALESDIPVLGICLGLQVFFEESSESPDSEGMGVLKGKVDKIETDLKLPHIGWNSLDIKKESCPLFEDITDGYVYYAHTYHAEPENDVVAATSDYGTDVTAIVWKDNVFGVQFHPEKSGKVGLKMLENFLRL